MIELIRTTELSDTEIAERSGFTVGHVSKVRRRYRKVHEYRPEHSPDEAREIRAMVRAGKSVHDIVSATGLSESWVMKVTADIRMLMDVRHLGACAKKAGMNPLAYVTLRRLEAMRRMDEITDADFEKFKKRLPQGELTDQIREWMLKTGKVINLCPTGKDLSRHNKIQHVLWQREAKRAAKNVSLGKARGSSPWLISAK